MKLSFLHSTERILLLLALCFALIYLFFYPPFYSAIDEHEYVKNAYLLSQGTLFAQDPTYACNGHLSAQGYISNYFLGSSFFLIPFTWLGFPFLFLFNLLVHLLTFYLIYLILKKLNVNPVYSALYLFLPALVWASRTLYPQLLVLFFALLGFYFYLSRDPKQWLFSGLFFSLAIFVRADALFLAAPFVVASFIKNRAKVLPMLFGLIPMGVLLLTINYFVYGSPLTTGYGSGSSLLSTLLNVSGFTFGMYVLILLIFYPLFIASPFLNKKFSFKLEFLLLALSLLWLGSSFTRFESFEFSLPNLFTIRLRYIIPLLGFLIIPYAGLLDNVFERLRSISFSKSFSKYIFPLSVIVLLALALVASSIHEDFLKDRKQVFDQIYSTIPKQSLVIGSSDDCMYFLKEAFGDLRYLKVNDPTIHLSDFIDDRTYVLDVHYSTVETKQESRKQVIDQERSQLSDFMGANQGHFQLILDSNQPHALKIYKYQN